MSAAADPFAHVPAWQLSIRAKCAHPTGRFVPFEPGDVQQSIPDRFHSCVCQHGDRLAVQAGKHSLTYRDLNRAANRVARAVLALRGDGREPIALLFDHGVPFIAAILGTLKAGKIYVPLDPAYPGARLRYMLEDSQAPVILTGSAHLALARRLAPAECQLTNVDELDSSVSDEDPGLSIPPDALAYIIYTSGSTGQPKGVVQPHRNVLHKIMMSTNDYHLCPEDRRTLLYSPSSSGSVWEIFSTLLNGGSAHAFDVREERIGDLVKWLIREEITIYSSVPTLFRHLASTLTGKERFPRVRLVNLGGDAVTQKDVELYRRHFPDDCVLVTTLAATETGTFRRYFVDKDTQLTGSQVPAGYPVQDKEVLLLDEHGKPAGPNQVGEIVVRGRFLSSGYWRRPEATRAKFVQDPEDGAMCRYSTGDLGRMLPDGCLVHMGRTDSQVKVRGHRVELAEIDMALLDVRGVKDAVVIQREDERGELRLVAYLVPAGDRAPTVSALRSALARTLPDHMVPSTFVTLDALPLTPAGKVDRRALPAPARVRPELNDPFVGPRTPLERVVAEIWADLLALDRVGIHDNFLDLGGHSLLATQIISRVISTVQVELPVRALFDSPTVAEMVLVILQNQAKRVEPGSLERMLAELEALSDKEAEARLGRRGSVS